MPVKNAIRRTDTLRHADGLLAIEKTISLPDRTRRPWSGRLRRNAGTSPA